MSLQETVSYWAYAILFYVYLLFFRLSIWFRQSVIYRTSPAYRKRSKMTGSILLLGDGLAEGVGDELSQGGLASRLNSLVRDHVDKTGLKFMWEFLTAGRVHTTSADWLPVSREDVDSKNSLFQQSLVSGPFRSAPIVILIVGSQDAATDESIDTVGNIVQIADAAARLGKHVLVAGIPCFAAAGSEEGRAIHAQNVSLAAALSALPVGEYGANASVSFGIDPQKVLVRGGDVVHVENSFVTLNGSGYRAYAREVHDEVALLAKRLEWSYFKERLR